jgi:putative redox protein
MPTIQTVYQGELRTNITHVASGQNIITDAPLDNQGKGEAISPTDMLSASLGSCMLTIMGIAAQTHGFNIKGLGVSITKHMAANPRRVSKIEIIFSNFPQQYSALERSIIEKAAKTCPVALSLHPDLIQDVEFIF